MGDAIGQVLSLGIGVAISPVPIIAVVLMLATPRGRVNGPAFLVGWLAGLTIVGTLVLLVAGGVGAADGDEPATWTGWLKLVLGALLVAITVRRWRRRPAPGDAQELPSWMAAVDHFTPGKTVAMGALLAGVNPKNLLLTVSAAAAIAQTGADTADQAVALAVFVVIGTAGPAVPVVIALTMGDRGRELLDGLKAWMGEHSSAIMAVLCLVIGAKLIGDGITVLAG
jgi:threonine/homoserine/homoserine lactone efflux protein